MDDSGDVVAAVVGPGFPGWMLGALSGGRRKGQAPERDFPVFWVAAGDDDFDDNFVGLRGWDWGVDYFNCFE